MPRAASWAATWAVRAAAAAATSSASPHLKGSCIQLRVTGLVVVLQHQTGHRLIGQPGSQHHNLADRMIQRN